MFLKNRGVEKYGNICYFVVFEVVGVEFVRVVMVLFRLVVFVCSVIELGLWVVCMMICVSLLKSLCLFVLFDLCESGLLLFMFMIFLFVILNCMRLFVIGIVWFWVLRIDMLIIDML